MGLSEKSFDVLLLNLGLVKRVFVEVRHWYYFQ